MMDWNNFFQILESIGVFGFGVTAFAFVIKSIFTHFLQKKDFNYQIKYSSLHEERILVVKEIYRLLINLDILLFLLNQRKASEPVNRNGIDKVNEDLNKLVKIFYGNEFFFEEKFCSSMNELITNLSKRSGYHEKLLLSTNNDTQFLSYTDFEIDYTAFEEEARKLLRQIKHELRKLLGVN